jgi:hypothetical protein
LDILRGALRQTEAAGGGRFVLYDDFGRLCLRRSSSLARNLLLDIDGGTAFTRTLSIDRDTYNQIRLICDSRRGRSVTVAGDARTQAEWGRLLLTERIADDLSARVKAAELLRRHNRPSRELTVGGVPGDPGVRAGCSVHASGRLTGLPGSTLWFIARARHVWNDGGYMMDLEMSI